MATLDCLVVQLKSCDMYRVSLVCCCCGYIITCCLSLAVGIIFETEIDSGDQGFLNKLRPVEHFNEVRRRWR